MRKRHEAAGGRRQAEARSVKRIEEKSTVIRTYSTCTYSYAGKPPYACHYEFHSIRVTCTSTVLALALSLTSVNDLLRIGASSGPMVIAIVQNAAGTSPQHFYKQNSERYTECSHAHVLVAIR